MGIQRALSRLIYGQEKHIGAQNATFPEFSMKEKHFGSHESVKSFAGIGESANLNVSTTLTTIAIPPIKPICLILFLFERRIPFIRIDGGFLLNRHTPNGRHF